MATRRSSNATGKLGGGCLVLFALPFAGFGVFALVQSMLEFTAGKWKSGLGLVLFALVFCGIGFGLMTFAVFESKKAKREEAIQQANPDEPWLWREDWARGEIRSADKAGVAVIWIFALFWNAISFTAFFAAFDEMKRKPAVLFVALFPLVGLALLAVAVRHTIRWRRFGDSVFNLTTIPGVIGGALAGVVHPARPLHGASEMRVRLVCFERDTSGDSTSEHVQWEDEKVLIGEVLRGGGIPVLFNVPFDSPPTATLSGSRSIVWRLSVSALVPGTDYAAQFEVPLFKTAASRANAPELPDPMAAYTKPVEAALPNGIIVRANASGGTEFDFAAARNRSVCAFLTFFTLLWTASVVALVKLKAPMAFPIIFGLIDLLLLLGVIGAWTNASRVVADLGGLLVTRRWCLVASREFVPAAEVQSIDLKLGMSSGETTYYDLVAVTTAGKKVKLASSIRGKKEAAWFAREIQNALARK